MSEDINQDLFKLKSRLRKQPIDSVDMTNIQDFLGALKNNLEESIKIRGESKRRTKLLNRYIWQLESTIETIEGFKLKQITSK